MTSIKNTILKIVEDNKIAMIPRWKFVMYSIFGAVGISFLFLILVFVLSLLLFVLSRYGFMYLPFFGFRATLHALTAIPFMLFGITILLLIVIEFFSKKYSFSFKRPLAVTLLSVTLLAAFFSFLVNGTTLHDSMRMYARGHRIDFMSRAYDRPAPFGRGEGMSVVRGIVIATTSNSFTLEIFGDETKVVNATTSETMKMIPNIGSDVVAFGVVVGDHFEVVAIRPAPRMPFEVEHHMRMVGELQMK